MLYYFLILFIISVLGCLAFKSWTKQSKPNAQAIEKIQKNISKYIALKQWEKAEKECLLLKNSSLGEEVSLILNLQVMQGMGRYDEAISLINQEIEKGHYQLLVQKAKFLLLQNEAEKAVNIYKSCREMIRSEEDVLDFAAALYEIGEITTAWNYLSLYIQDSQQGKLFALAADCQFYWENYSDAKKFYQKAIHLNFTNQRILLRLGHTLLALNEEELARDYFSKILEKDSSDIAATLGMGQSFEKKGLYERALIAYQQGRAWDLSSPVILRQAGICAARIKLFELAQIYLQEALSKGNKDLEAFCYLGYVLEKQKLWNQAEKIYLQMVELYPNQVNGYRGIAWLYGAGLTTLLDDDEALKIAKKGVDLVSDRTSWQILSDCQERAGNFREAYAIQETLLLEDHQSQKLKRQHLMKVLRKKEHLKEEELSLKKLECA